jgi:hypothetical protein
MKKRPDRVLYSERVALMLSCPKEFVVVLLALRIAMSEIRREASSEIHPGGAV